MFGLHPIKCQNKDWIHTHTFTHTVTPHTTLMKTLGNGYMQMRFFFFFFYSKTFYLRHIVLKTDSWLAQTSAEQSRKRSGSIEQLSFFCCSYFSEITKHYLLILQSFHSLVIVNGEKGHINNFIFFLSQIPNQRGHGVLSAACRPWQKLFFPSTFRCT